MKNMIAELSLIKAILFNAQSVQQALNFLDDLDISYRAADMLDWYSLTGHDIQFWRSRSAQSPVSVCIDGKLVPVSERQSFLAAKIGGTV